MAEIDSAGQPAAAVVERKDGVGWALSAAREKRGISAVDAASQAKVPLHYVTMLEADDYEKVSDRLYLLPFLRKYAAFLNLDADGIGTRFVREAVRAENNAARIPARVPQMGNDGRRNVWITTGVVALFVLVALYLALGASRRKSASGEPESASPTARQQPAPEAPVAALPPSSIVSAPAISGASANAIKAPPTSPGGAAANQAAAATHAAAPPEAPAPKAASSPAPAASAVDRPATQSRPAPPATEDDR